MPPSLLTLVTECRHYLKQALAADHLAVVAVLEPELDSLLDAIHQQSHKAP